MESNLCCVLNPIAICTKCGWEGCRTCPDTHSVSTIGATGSPTLCGYAYCPKKQEYIKNLRWDRLWILS
jgi:hypothetical protein